MPELPHELRLLAETGLRAMERHPDHHYDWQTRRLLYRTCRSMYPAQVFSFTGWLAVYAAQYVLPIFTSSVTDDGLPQQLVTYAEKIMKKQRRPRSSRVSYLLDQGYLCTGLDCLDWRTITAYNAEYAGTTAYKALIEASGQHDLLGDIEHGIQRGWVKPRTRIREDEQPVYPSDITDSDIAHLAAFGDTAGSAAIAYACARESFTLDATKLRHFWEWWVRSALPQAWQQATNEDSFR
jgi:hypothetical protein